MAPPLIMDCLSAGHSPAEFDAYAADYDAGMDNPLKKRLGSDAASFVEVKVDWLLGTMRRRPQLDPWCAEHDSSIMDAVREPSRMYCDSADMKAPWPAATSRSRCWPKPGGVGPEARCQAVR